MFSLYEYQQLDNSTIVKNGVKKIVSVVCILKLKFGLLFACMKILNGFFFPCSSLWCQTYQEVAREEGCDRAVKNAYKGRD